MADASAAPREPAADALIGGRYSVECVLGEGGMGSVLQVRDVRSGRRLALKRARADRGKSAAALFEREYFTLCELAHPRIIEVYDYGVDAQGAYYTMELLDGADLRERRNLPVREVCALLCDVASSLAILHSRNLLHRDVSLRNVRCTSDGRAKLIDFGAMAPMGVSPEIVGTPPCVPPEAVQLQALDGRADLYALGVVAYWMLAGRYPFPAHKLADLPELWLSDPPALETFAGELPEPLSQLVMQLISVERDGRPRTAGEVVARLSAIAGLELRDEDSVARAYLTTPSLVDRGELVSWARTRMQALQERRGQTLVIEGDPGTGRSRALDACVAEAKRVGAVVARTTANQAGKRDHGVATTLARQLLANLPASAASFGVRERAVLGHVLEELRRPGDPELPLERGYVQAALRDWMLGLARDHALMLAVDDIEQVDEPSLALLAILAHEIPRRSMIIAVTRRLGADDGFAADVLLRLGTTIQVAPLSEAKTEELVRSVFGDVENVVGVARRVHEITRGNPRDSVHLLRHLVERGVARCEGAAWLLPHELTESDLPRSMRSVFEARVAALSADARELAEALALTDPATVSIEEYPELAGTTDPARLFCALGALVSSDVLLPDGDRGNRYRFAEPHAPSWLEQAISPDRKRALHARLAELCERRAEPMRRLHHLLESGQATLAISELVATIDTVPLAYTKHTVELLERAVSASQNLCVPEVHRLALKLRVAGVSAVIADIQTFQRYAPEVLARLRRDTGLDDWEALGDGVPAGERLQTALMRAQQRYQSTPEAEQGFSPFESIRKLARLLLAHSSMSGQATDLDLVKRLPSLAPFFPLSPATAVIQNVLDGQRAMEEGQISKARELYPQVLARIAEPDGAGIEPLVLEQLKYGVTYIVAAIDASRALPSTLAFADELDKVPKYRANAWHVRRSYYRMLGQIGRVRECQRRIELLQLRDGPQPFRNVNFRSDLPACWLSDDITGMKSSFAGIEAEAARFPGLRVLAEVARCHYHRLLGDYERAFEHLAIALERARPGAHIDWHHVGAAHVQMLTLLGRPDEAIRQTDAYLAACDELGLDRAVLGLEMACIPALLAMNRAAEARERCDRQLALAEAEGIEGILLARCHEMQARIALALGDRAGFESSAERFAAFARASENPAIRAQYERLVRLGSGSGAELQLLPNRPDREHSHVTGRSTSAALKTRLAHCIDRTERARVALSLVLDACEAKRGHLFGVQQAALEHLATFPGHEPPELLMPALAELLEHERHGDEATVMDEGADAASAAQSSPYFRLAALGFYPQVLIATQTGDRAIVGIVTLEREPGDPVHFVPPEVAESIAEALAEQGDVDPMTCFVARSAAG